MPAAEARSISQAVAAEAFLGLTAQPKTLSPWLFYDAEGSALFERITELPEYYLTRTERELLATCSDAILDSLPTPLTIAELGAGTATKTGLLLQAASRRQPHLLYQPIDVSASSLQEARALERSIPRLTVNPQLANYITDSILLQRPPGAGILALYIGSSIGNFSPEQAAGILLNLRAHLRPGDALLLGTDLAPGPNKSLDTLIAAYNDAEGVTAAFNKNVLSRLNRDLGTRFHTDCFRHVVRWNPIASRIEMHLESLAPQTVHLPGDPGATLHFTQGESIHTENSYKFTRPAIEGLLRAAAFTPTRTFQDACGLYAVTLAIAA